MKLSIVLTIVLVAFASADQGISLAKDDVVNLAETFIKAVESTYENPDARREITIVINRLTDLGLLIVRQILTAAKLNSVPLPDQKVNVDQLRGSLQLTNGALEGIASIIRSDDVLLRFNTEQKRVSISFHFAFEELNVLYAYLFEALLINAQGGLEGGIEELTFNSEWTFEFGDVPQITLHSFDLKNTGAFKFELSGNGVSDTIINVISGVIASLVQPALVEQVGAVVQGALQNVVDTLNIVLEQIFNRSSNL